MHDPGRLLEVSWDGFDNNIRKEMEWLWRDQTTLTDVTVFCEGGSVRAHKIILAMNSSYFYNLFLETNKGCCNSVISLRAVDLEDFKVLLEYMYRGKVHVGEKIVKRVVDLAQSLYVRGFGPDSEYPRSQRQRNGSVTSVYADSDGENDQFDAPVYIRPEEIPLQGNSMNRVTRGSLATQSSPKSHRLSESNPKRNLGEPGARRRTNQDLIDNASSSSSSTSSVSGRSPSYTCSHCDFSTTTHTILLSHKAEKHSGKRSVVNVQAEKSRDAAVPSSSLQCDTCGFIAGNPGALANHRNRHKQDKTHSSPKTSLIPLDYKQHLASVSEHFKIIYDCPRCIQISFRTAAIIVRHFMKRHQGEPTEATVRVACAHCHYTFPLTDDKDDYVKHLMDLHTIDVTKEFAMVTVKTEPVESIESNQENGHCSTLTVNGTVNDSQHIETCSNADTERASSRGSYAAVIKRSRISHDDEATIEDADLSKVKKEPEENEPESLFHKCTQCAYQVSQKHFLRRHMIACHSNGVNENQFLCKSCNFSTSNRSTMKSHLVCTHEDRTTKVKECYRNSEQIKALLKNMPVNVDTAKRKAAALNLVPAPKRRGRPCLSEAAKKLKAKAGATPKNNIAMRLKKAAIEKQRRRTDGMIENDKPAKQQGRASLDERKQRNNTRLSSPRLGKYATMARISLKCPDCTYVAKSDAMFEKHANLHRFCDENKLALCEICGVVKKKGSMGYHMKKHETEAKESSGLAQTSP